MLVPQPTDQVQAAHLGHAEVCDDEVDGFPLHDPQGRRGVEGRADLEPDILKRLLGRL